MHNAVGVARCWLHAGRAMRIMKRRNVREVVRNDINCACINIVNIINIINMINIILLMSLIVNIINIVTVKYGDCD